jgi:hypothetical protein
VTDSAAAIRSLGIDAGDLATAWAVVVPDRRAATRLDGKRFRSVVTVGSGGRLRAGIDSTGPGTSADGVVGRLGDATPVVLGGTPYGSESLVACLLGSAYVSASQATGTLPTVIGIAHADDLDPYRLGLLVEACRVAGLPTDQLELVPHSAAREALAGEPSLGSPDVLAVATGAALAAAGRRRPVEVVDPPSVGAVVGVAAGAAVVGGVAVTGVAAAGAGAVTGAGAVSAASTAAYAGAPLAAPAAGAVPGYAGTSLTAAAPGYAGAPLAAPGASGYAGAPLSSAAPGYAGAPLTPPAAPPAAYGGTPLHAPVGGPTTNGGSQSSALRRGAQRARRILQKPSPAHFVAAASTALVVAAGAALVVHNTGDTSRPPTASAPPASGAPGATSPATAAPSGSVVAGKVGPDGSSASTFTAATGEVVYIAAAPGCTRSDLSYKVVDAKGTLLALAGLCTDIGRVVFPDGGSYQVVVSSATGQPDSFAYRRLSSRPDRVTKEALGTPLTGTIDLPGANDVHDIDVTAGTVGYIGAGDACSQPDLGYKVVDPHGTLLSLAGICSDIGRVVFKETGTYHVVVTPNGQATGGYSLRTVVSRADLVTPFTLGGTIDGNIDLAGANDVHEVTVQAGAIGYVEAAATCAADHLGYQIFDPVGRLMSLAGVCSDIGRVVFDTPGTYRIVVSGNGAATGAYSLTTFVTRPDVHADAVVGGTSSGTIDTPGAQDSYAFTVEAGTVVYVGAADGCGDDHLGYKVLGPNGVLVSIAGMCSDVGRLVLADAGTYQLVVTGNGPATGSYGIRLDQVRPDRRVPTTVGATIAGTIDQAGAHDDFVFQGRAGTKLNFTPSDACSSSSLIYSITGADGIAFDDAGTCSEMRNVVLPTTDEYHIVVQGIGQATGSYSLSWSPA